MPNIDAWLTDAFPLPDWEAGHDMAVDTALLISDKSVTITIRRGNVELDPQTVRIEALGNMPNERRGENATVAVQQVLILGYKGHPTIEDSDIKRGDRFYLSDEKMIYTIVQVIPDLRDSVQAIAQAGQGA